MSNLEFQLQKYIFSIVGIIDLHSPNQVVYQNPFSRFPYTFCNYQSVDTIWNIYFQSKGRNSIALFVLYTIFTFNFY